MKRPPVFNPGAFKPGVFRKRHPRRVHPRLKGLSINHLLPNVLTVLALCAGLTAIRFAIDGQWRPAVVSVVTAAILDALDGRIARLLNGQSKFGAELDSLSDVVSFGVAPALMMYLWALSGAGSFGWIAALAYAVCMALRLARFNSRLGAPDLPPWAFNYFTGVPAPAGAGLVLLPMVAGFEVDPALVSHPVLVVPWTLAMALLLVSTLPTFSGKGMRVPTDFVVPALVGVGLLAAFLVAQPWWTLILLGLAYIGLIPVSLRQFRKLQRAAADIQAPAADGEPPAALPVAEDAAAGEPAERKDGAA